MTHDSPTEIRDDWPRRLGRLVPESRARTVLIGGCLLTILLSVWAIVALPKSSDLWFYKHWSRLVTLEGISAAYSGEPSPGYVDYPPLLLYPWKIEILYRRFVDPGFDEDKMLESSAHVFGLAMISLVFHLAVGLALYRLVGRQNGAATATTVSILYLLNPAALFDIGGLGLLDSVHSFWLVLAFGLAERGSTRAGWATAALGALTKPQAWGLAPLFIWRRLCTDRMRTNFAGVATAIGVTIIVIAPFIFDGKFRDLCSLPAHMADVQPYVSVQAHNLWWLATLGDGIQISDATLLLGPITCRHVSLALLCLSGFLVLWLSRKADTKLFLQLPAFQAFAWFCLTTRAHENHWFFVLPLTALALPSDRRVMWIFIAISITGFLNLLLHDPFFGPPLASIISNGAISAAKLLNSAANLTILALWSAMLIHARRQVSDG